MNKRIAIIDLGSNTCNLLIAEISEQDYKILYQGKEHVRLIGKRNGDNRISENGFFRASQALANHQRKINDYSADKILVIATSAIREAANRDEFVEFIKDKTGLHTDVVTGDREAELIFNGVLLAFGEIRKPTLILDIGGGSNEMIIAGSSDIVWKESIPAGMARMINLFDLSDPIKPEELLELQRFFRMQNSEATKQCKSLDVSELVGCSGAFDTIADLIDRVEPGVKKRVQQKIELSHFYKVYDKLIKSTRNERTEMKGMDNVRIDLIVPAVILIKQIISDLGIEKISQTDFALREGVLFEML